MSNATQVDFLSDGRSSDVAPTPVFKEFAPNGVILVCKKCLIAPFRAQGRCLTQVRHVKDETASKTSPCGGRALRRSLRHVLAARA